MSSPALRAFSRYPANRPARRLPEPHRGPCGHLSGSAPSKSSRPPSTQPCPGRPGSRSPTARAGRTAADTSRTSAWPTGGHGHAEAASIRPPQPPVAAAFRSARATGRPPARPGSPGRPAPAGSPATATAAPRRSSRARPVPRRSWSSPAIPVPMQPGRTATRPRPAGRPRTARPAPARSGTGASRDVPAPEPWSGGQLWPGTAAVRSGASTGPADARRWRAGTPVSRSRSSPPTPSPPPPV